MATQNPNKPRFGRPIFKPFTYNGHQYVQAGDGRWHHASTEVVNGQVVFKPGIPVTDSLQMEITESRLPGGPKAPKGPDILAPRPNPLPVQPKKPIIPRKPLTASDFEKLLNDPKSKALRHLFNIRDEQKAKQKRIQKHLDMLPFKDFRKRYQAINDFSTADKLKALFRVLTNQTPKDIKSKQQRETKQEVMQERRIEKVPGEDVNTGAQGVIVKIEKNTNETVRYLQQLIKHFKIRENADAVAADFEQEKRDDEKLFEDKVLQKLDKNGKPIAASNTAPPSKADKDMGWLEKAFGIGLEGLEIGLVAGLASSFIPVLAALGIVAGVAGVAYAAWEAIHGRGPGLPEGTVMLNQAPAKPEKDMTRTDRFMKWLGYQPNTAKGPAYRIQKAITPFVSAPPSKAGETLAPPASMEAPPPEQPELYTPPEKTAPISKMPPNYKADAQAVPPNPAVTDLATMLSNDPKLPGGFNQVTATEDAYHKKNMGPNNPHNRGLAMDFTLKNGNDSEQAVAYLKSMMDSLGVRTTILNEYEIKTPGQTGKHIHVAFKTPADALKFETHYRSIKTAPRNTGNMVVAASQAAAATTTGAGAANPTQPIVINKSSNNTVKKSPKRKPTPPTGQAYNTDPTFWNSVVGTI